MEQFGDEGFRADLDQGRNGPMAEDAIGLLAHLKKVLRRDLVAGEGAKHGRRNLGIGPASEPGDLVGRKDRPGLRHIEPAVWRQAAQDGIGEADRWRAPAGREVAHAQDFRR